MSCQQRRFEVAEQIAKRSGQRLPPRDENIVIARQTIKGEQTLGGGFEPPSGTIAGHCIADLPARSETCAYRHARTIRCGAEFKGYARRNASNAASRAQKISSLLKSLDFGLWSLGGRPASAVIRQADSLFRP